MLNRQIYRTLFNLDKDRQDRGLPAGNPAIQPMQTPLGAMGGSEQAPAPLPDEVKKRLPVPTPPTSQPAPAVTAEVDTYVDPMGGHDLEEQQRIPEVAAAAAAPIRTKAEEQRLQSVLSQKPRTAQKSGEPDLNAIRTKQSTEAQNREAQRLEAVRGLDGDISIPAGAVNAPAPINYAEQEAALQEQARKALIAPPLMRPGTAKDQAKGDKKFAAKEKKAAEEADYQERLKAALPFENPQNQNERAKNRLAELRFKAENPRNEDRGVKGFIREMLQNFSYGLSGAASVPGISIPQALMLGGVGAGAGLLNRSWNEQRMAQQQLDGAYKDAAFESDLANKERALGIQEQGVGIRRDAEERQKEKVLLDADYKTRSLGIQEKYRNEYLDLLRTRDVYKNANDKKKAEQAERRIKVLEDRYKLDEQKVGVQMGRTKMHTKNQALKMAEVIEQRIAALGADATPEQRQLLEAALASLAPSLRQ